MENTNLPTESENITEAPVTQSSPIETPPTSPNVLVANRKPIIFAVVAVMVILAISSFFYFKRSRVSVSLQSELPAPVIEVAPKPTEVDISDWATYTDAQTGFSFKYPPNLVMVNSEVLDENQLSLSVDAEKLADIPEDLPLFMGRNDALEQKALLAKGVGESFVKIGSLYGNTSSTYSMFEVCSVMFVRKLVFFPNDYRVMLTLIGPEAKMIEAMPSFFKVDPTNCGDSKMWNQDYKTDFETTLANHQGQGLAQTWYDTFYKIVETVQLVTPTEIVAPSPTQVSSDLTYKNETYGFELTYEKPYKVLTSKEDLYGYPKGVVLLYTGGQVYNIVIEVWDTQADYEKEYEFRMADIKVIQNKGKFITLLNNDPDSAENQKIIDSVKLVP